MTDGPLVGSENTHHILHMLSDKGAHFGSQPEERKMTDQEKLRDAKIALAILVFGIPAAALVGAIVGILLNFI